MNDFQASEDYVRYLEARVAALQKFHDEVLSIFPELREKLESKNEDHP